MTKITLSPVRAVITRAYYRQNSHERLKEFSEGLLTGLIADRNKDSTVIVLRNWLLQNHQARTRAVRVEEVYAKTELALVKFLENEAIKALRSVKEEQFPLPQEESNYASN